MDDGLIWYRIDLNEVAGLIDDYVLWKDEPWYHSVNWTRASGVVDEVLQSGCQDGVVTGDLAGLLVPFERTLRRADREGLVALISSPLQISRFQLHDGGHRATAMRRQGVRFAPGLCVRSDVGSGINARQVYPVTSVG